MRARFINSKNEFIMNKFQQGGDPYEKMEIGQHRDPIVGDKIYIKPNAIEIYNKRIETPIGNTDIAKLWFDSLRNLSIVNSYEIKQVLNNSIIILNDNDAIEIEKFLVSYFPNDEKYSLEHE